LTQKKGKGKAIPLQAWTGPEGSRRMRLPDFTTMTHEGGKVVSPGYRPPLPPGNIPSTHPNHPKAIVRPEGLCQWKNSNDTIGNRTRDLPACNEAPPRALIYLRADLTANKETRYAINSRLGGAKSQYGQYWKRENLCWDSNHGS